MIDNYNGLPCVSAFNPSYTSGTFVTSPTTTSTFTLILPYLTPWTTTTNSYTITSTISARIYVTGTYAEIRCASIQVRWQSTDTEILSLLQLTGKPTTATTVHPTSTPTQLPQTGNKNTGKIVAGVLVPILVIAFIIAVLLWLRRRRHFREGLGVDASMMDAIDGKS